MRKTVYFIIALIVTAAIVVAALYVYRKKFKKISTVQPDATMITDSAQTPFSGLASHVLFTDFESYEAKEELYTELAHSGQYSYKVFGSNSFSAVLTGSVSSVGKQHMNRIGFSAYVYILPENFETLKADLVFSVVDAKGNNVIWQGVTLSPVYTKAGEWFKVSGAFDADTTTIPPDGTIKTYLWNDSKTNILIDDMLVVFGKDEVQRGDTTWYDNTGREPFVRKHNQPPFPIEYIHSDTVNSIALKPLLKNNRTVCKGNFYNPANRLDKILSVDKSQLTTYSFCKTSGAFTQDLTYTLQAEDSLWKSSTIMPAHYAGKPTEEILLYNKQHQTLSLHSIGNTIGEECLKSPSPMKLQTLWTGNVSSFLLEGHIPTYITPFYPTTTQKALMLVIYANGQWGMYEYMKNDWSLYANSKTPIEAWANQKNEFKIVRGHFQGPQKGEQLLTLSGIENNDNEKYTLFEFKQSSRNFMKLNSGQQTLNTTDKLSGKHSFFGITTSNKMLPDILLMLDTTWRFDMKQLTFNPDGCNIANSIDFKVDNKQYNPKYYEDVVILPGNFIKQDNTSLICICRNPSSPNPEGYKQLPNTVSIYSFKH